MWYLFEQSCIGSSWKEIIPTIFSKFIVFCRELFNCGSLIMLSHIEKKLSAPFYIFWHFFPFFLEIFPCSIIHRNIILRIGCISFRLSIKLALIESSLLQNLLWELFTLLCIKELSSNLSFGERSSFNAEFVDIFVQWVNILFVAVDPACPKVYFHFINLLALNPSSYS